MIKRILATIAALGVTLVALAADTKISAYPSMSALGGTEIFLGNQSGVTGTATAAQFSTYVRAANAALTASSFSFTAGSSYSGASWNTTSPVFNGAAMTLNDTTASGTVTTEMAYSLQAPTYTSTGGASTTITNAGTLFITTPVCSGGLVCTNRWAIYSTGGIFTVGVPLQSSGGTTVTGAAVNLNASANFAVNVGTGTNNTTTTIGGTTAGNNVNLASISTKVGGILYASSTAPTINSHFNTSGDSIVASSTAAFQITVGSGTGTSTGSVTMPTATTGWACEATDVTTPATNAVQQTASSTTGVTVTNYVRTTGVAGNFTNGDKINFVCGAF